MRTTLTLDDDVAAQLTAEANRSGTPFAELVNECLRRGLHSQKLHPARKPFRVEARDMGRLRPGLSLDAIGELLDRVEGPTHR